MSGEDRLDRGERNSVKDMLKMYYGLGEEGVEVNEEGTIETQAPDPMDIDSPSFDTRDYVKRLQESSGMNAVLRESEKLQGEIKSLDQEMKTLVYENYSKFITATDTIRDMKQDIVGMEDEMEKLSSSMESLSNISHSVNEVLNPRRSEIGELLGVQRLLLKLHFIIELPARLQKCLEMEAYDVAVNYYNQVAPILKMHQDTIQSFVTIAKESKDVIEVIRTKVKEILFSENVKPSSIDMSTSVLLKLGEVPKWVLDKFMQRYSVILTESIVNIESENPRDYVVLLDQNFFQSYLEYQRSRESIFSAFGGGNGDSGGHDAVIFPSDSPLFQPYFAKLKARLGAIKEQRPLVEAIRAVQNDFSLLRRSVLKKDKELVLLFEDAIRQVIREFIDTRFALSTECYMSDLDNLFLVGSVIYKKDADDEKDMERLKFAQANALSEFVLRFTSSLSDISEILEKEDEMIVDHSSSVCIGFADVNVQRMLLSILDKISTLSTQAKEGTPINLLLSVLCDSFANKLGDLFLAYEKHMVFIFNKNDLIKRFRDVGEEVLQKYILVEADRISKMFERGIATPNWLEMGEPRGPRLAVEYALESVMVISNIVFLILPEAQQPDTGSSHSSHISSTIFSATQMASFRNIESKIDRLFNAELFDFHVVELKAASILSVVIKIVAKSFMECIRLQTLGVNGYRQMQVDIHFFRSILDMLIDDQRLLDFISHELFSSAADRCTDPKPLDIHVIENICAEKRLKFVNS